MVYKIVYKPYAEHDIWEIAAFLWEYSISAAHSLLKKIKFNIKGLSEMPLRFPKINPHQEYRKMMVEKYIVVYLVDECQNQVIIIRVVHGMRNYQEQGFL
ncbi:MAG: type II toxin-antitoxin system RelE/ParE family toxin [Firmicutes bacterium]|nr:type II toxin-antitoxin system RelE/ParE family toxin [Bacillota bacterium]